MWSQHRNCVAVVINFHPVCVGRTPEAALQALDANYRNYRLIERNLLQSKARQMGKLPEIQKAEEAVALLLRKRAATEEVHCLHQ